MDELSVADCDLDTTDMALAKRRLAMAHAVIAAYLRLCPARLRHAPQVRQAIIAQATAYEAASIDPANPTSGPRVIASKSLQSASISYADSSHTAAGVESLRAGGISPAARIILASAGIQPRIRVIG